MKKITLIATLVCAIICHGQRRVTTHVQELNAAHASFKHFEPLTASPAIKDRWAINNATYATLNAALTKNIAQTKPQTLELGIPYNGEIINVQLYRAGIFAQGFHADTDKQKNFDYAKGAYYRGIINGDNASIASFSFFENELYGMVSSAGLNNLVIGKLKKEGNVAEYIIYSDADLNILNEFKCGTSDLPELQHTPKKQPFTAMDAQSQRCVSFYFEIDHEIYLQNDSSQVTTANWITAMFNNIQTLYDNDGISVSLKSFFIWTEQDPFFGSDSEEYLIQFLTAWQNIDFDGDLGQLIGIDEGGLGGLAPLEGLCDDPLNGSYVDVDLDFQEVPLYSWNIQAMTHEIGHQLGSPHTHACAWNGNNTAIDGCGILGGADAEGSCPTGPIPPEGGTIMSYCHLVWTGVNLANGFGPQPAQLILNFVNSSNCTGTSCVPTACHSFMSNFSIETLADGQAIVSWEDETPGPWQVSVTQMGSTPSPWQEVETTTINVNGLQPNTYYSVKVRPDCDDDNGDGIETIYATPADWCAGQQFTDAGGANGNYSPNQHFVRTLSPADANHKIKVTFTSFALEEGFDFLKIYDGPDTSATLLGVFSGFNLPGEFTSTAEDGSLTFAFDSDEIVNGPGWNASVSCIEILGNPENTFTGLQYWPNPAQNTVNINAATDMEEVTVYSVTGQLLLQQKVNAAQTTVNIESLAKGVYIFKITGGTKESAFRIVKQ